VSEIVISQEDRVAANATSLAPADCSAGELAERRYLSIFDPLVTEAAEQRTMETLVDCLTWTLARVAAAVDDPYVPGDILKRLGTYICRIEERKRAQAEADRARKEGRVPH
jgi:hypothetical protein